MTFRRGSSSSLFRSIRGPLAVGLVLGVATAARAKAPTTLPLPKTLATPTCFVRRAEAGGGVCVLTLKREEEYHGITMASLYLDGLQGLNCDSLGSFELRDSEPNDAVLGYINPQTLAEVSAHYDLTQHCDVRPLALNDAGEADFDVGGAPHHLRRAEGQRVVRLDDGREVQLPWTMHVPRWVVVHDDKVGILTSDDGAFVTRDVLGYALADLKASSPPPAPPVKAEPPTPAAVAAPVHHLAAGPLPITSQERCLGWDAKARALWLVHRPDACVDAGGEDCPDEARLERVGPGKAKTLLLGARGVGGVIDADGVARADKALTKVNQGCIASDVGSPVVGGVTVDVRIDGGHVVLAAGPKTIDLGAIELGEAGATTREGLGPTYWNPAIRAVVVEVDRTSDRGDSQRYLYADLKALGVR